MEFRRSKPGGNGRGGGGGPNRGKKNGGGRGGRNNGHSDRSPSRDYYNSNRDYDEPKVMHPKKNAWDDHAAEVDERLLVEAGLIPPRDQWREEEPHERENQREPSSYHDEYAGRGGGNDNADYGNRNGDYGNEQYPPPPHHDQLPAVDAYGYDNGPPVYQQQQQLQPYNGQQRSDTYRSERPMERETITAIEDEYIGWSLADLQREFSRLQRRMDVVRSMRDSVEQRDIELARNNSAPPYQHNHNHNHQHQNAAAVNDDSGQFMQNVRDGESFYERDAAGYSPLGRQAYETQQRRNEQSRGYIPADGLARFSGSGGFDRDEQLSSSRRRGGPEARGGGGEGGRRRREEEEERRDEESSPRGGGGGGGRDGQNYRSAGNYSSTPNYNSESETRRVLYGKKKRKSKHRGPPAAESDSSSSTCRATAQRRATRSSGYSTTGSAGSLAVAAAAPLRCASTIHEEQHAQSQSSRGSSPNMDNLCVEDEEEGTTATSPQQQFNDAHVVDDEQATAEAEDRTRGWNTTSPQQQNAAVVVPQATAWVEDQRGWRGWSETEARPMEQTSGRGEGEGEERRQREGGERREGKRAEQAKGGGAAAGEQTGREAAQRDILQRLGLLSLTPSSQHPRTSMDSPLGMPGVPPCLRALASTPPKAAAAAAAATVEAGAAAPASPAAAVQPEVARTWTPTDEIMTGDRSGARGGYRGSGGADRGSTGGSGSGRSAGGRGGRGGIDSVSSMALGQEPAPSKSGEQDGYKAAAKPAPALREGKGKIRVISNVWQLEYEDRLVYQYDVNVGLEALGNDGSSRIFNVNKGPRDDASVHERNELIRAALKRGLEMYRLLSENGCIAADGASMMYSNENLDAALKPHDYKIRVGVEDLPEEVRQIIRNNGVKNVVIEVVATKSFNIKDLSGQMSIDRSDIDQSVKQFFEVITSEHALRNHSYSFFTGGKLYRDDPDRLKMGGGNRFARPIGSGQERRDGMSKGFTLAANNGQIIGALNIDVTTGTFWSEGKLLQTIMEINGWQRPQDAVWDARSIKRTNELIKNLRVSYAPPDGGSSFDFVASGITARAWCELNGNVQKQGVKTIEHLTCKNPMGQEEPLFNRFSQANLRLLDWPLIESKRARRRTDDPTKFDVSTEYFPIELLDVRANQRVPLKKQGADPERAMPVEDRWRGTAKALDALNLFGDTRASREPNEIMKAFGIRLARTPLETQGIVRRMPAVTFNQAAEVDAKTTFKTGQLSYKTPAHITMLVIAISDKLHGFNEQSFARALLDTARNKKRMRIDNHLIETVAPNKLHDRLSRLRKDKLAGDKRLCKAVFLYVEPEAGKHHDDLKLFERRYCIVTQHLTMENASKMERSRSLMENVLLKLNVKGGGHNYHVQPEKFALDLWMNKQTMIMGYDVWHPTGQTRVEKLVDCLPEPSVVGFSFNGGVTPDSFIGDYHFQQPTKERVNDDVLNARIKWMLSTFERSRGCLPPLIVVVRDGISDGQYRHGMDELEALREGATEYASSMARAEKLKKPPVHGYAPKFIFVVATKRHHKRMYTEYRGAHGNMPAMSVVDDAIVNPGLFEFFLQSHTPLQGMAKATKYTVLKDDVGTTSDAMQALMGALCFAHQVSTNAISIPEPVYQSDEWAKRGASNMRKFREVYGEKGQFKVGFTYEDLTKRLSYWNSELELIRVNA